jgi:ABC-type multidrug transport system ATPase subunit
MKISLTNAGKRYNRDWIFRRFSYEFIPGMSYAITGANGSGKSTLLQIVGGAIAMSEGTISYESLNSVPEQSPSTGAHQTMSDGGKDLKPVQIPIDNAYRNISVAAPYLEVIEEMTVTEFLSFHQQFKKFIPGYDVKKIISLIGLERAAHKQIRYYSSGMKQRVKLAQAIFSDTSCLLLDEPVTNLDREGIALYKTLISEHSHDRLVIVSSNDEEEYFFCQERLDIARWKDR